jgi:ribonuclease HI
MPARSKHPSHPKKLFEEPSRPTDVWCANVDGASRGNPGPASYAALIRKPNGEVAARIAKYIGRSTNNVAEYYGLMAALDYAAAHGVTKLRIESDSLLLVQQMRGLYKVKSADLKPLHERARKQAGALAYFEIVHVPREKNADADALANDALDGTRVAAAFRRAPESGEEENRNGKMENRLAEKSIRAHFWDGVLVPEEPLELSDGDKVKLTIQKLPGD